MERTIAKTWRPRAEQRSAIHRAAAILAPGRWQEFDPFLMLAEDWFRQGTFEDHPHRGIETVTYVISGHMAHYDNKSGHSGVLGPGDAQWMTAGHGVIHKEDPVPGEEVHSLQLWINLPRDQKLMPPRYQDLAASTMPQHEEPGVTLKLYSGAMNGIQSHTVNVVPVLMAELVMEEGASSTLPIPTAYNGFLYILDGEGAFGEQNTAGTAGEVLWLGPAAGDVSTVSVYARSSLRFLVYAGLPLNQPVAAYGPFVMTTSDEIRQAIEDYRAGRFL